MRRSILVALLALAALLAAWSVVSWAQVIDGDPCRDACYQTKAACITECSHHRNPMDCESACRETLQDCLDQCGE
jgi:hypothetical protein